MAEKKIHWKTAQKLAKETGQVVAEETPIVDMIEEPKHGLSIDFSGVRVRSYDWSTYREIKPIIESKKSDKTEWTVVVGETPIFTYRISDTEDAYERALKLAIKKGGKVI